LQGGDMSKPPRISFLRPQLYSFVEEIDPEIIKDVGYHSFH